MELSWDPPLKINEEPCRNGNIFECQGGSGNWLILLFMIGIYTALLFFFSMFLISD